MAGGAPPKVFTLRQAFLSPAETSSPSPQDDVLARTIPVVNVMAQGRSGHSMCLRTVPGETHAPADRGQHPARERRPSAPLALSGGLLRVPEPPRGGAELRCPPSLPEAPALARHSDVHRLSDSVPVPGHAPGAGPTSQRLPPGPAPAQVPLATCVGSRGGAGDPGSVAIGAGAVIPHSALCPPRRPS